MSREILLYEGSFTDEFVFLALGWTYSAPADLKEPYYSVS
jgi:hypothetical protein